MVAGPLPVTMTGIRSGEDAMAEEPIEVSRTEARAGASTHVTRYVLPISLGLIVGLFIVLLVIFA
jgi:hypothetical protein